MSAIYLIGLAGVLSGPVTLMVVPGIGCQMPDNAVELPQVLDDPADGFVWALVGGGPVLLPDHRGTVYSTATGEEQSFNELGALPLGLTVDPRPGPFHVWQAGAWHLDAAAQMAAQSIKAKGDRDSRLASAQLRIAPLQYAVNLDMATEQEKAALLAWMRYSVELNRVEAQPGYPLTIEWPVPPGGIVTA